MEAKEFQNWSLERVVTIGDDKIDVNWTEAVRRLIRRHDQRRQNDKNDDREDEVQGCDQLCARLEVDAEEKVFKLDLVRFRFSSPLPDHAAAAGILFFQV